VLIYSSAKQASALTVPRLSGCIFFRANHATYELKRPPGNNLLLFIGVLFIDALLSFPSRYFELFCTDISNSVLRTRFGTIIVPHDNFF
jgi:hypothetical protein